MPRKFDHITRQFHVGCELTYEVLTPCSFIFNVSVVDNNAQQIIEEHFTTDPELEIEESRSTGEEKRHHRFNADPGMVRVRYSATVELAHHFEAPHDVPEMLTSELPAHVMPYLYPSRYCESDKLGRLAQRLFGNLHPGYWRVTAICNWVYENVEYLRGSTNPRTSAYDTAAERAGVCRDFAHLAIAFCRALCIPARFVSGYAYNLFPPDFHAYFEAYLGGHWYIFDPTRLSPQTSFVRIGTGRDAADTSFATIFGSVGYTDITVHMDIVEGEERPPFTVKAISTS